MRFTPLVALGLLGLGSGSGRMTGQELPTPKAHFGHVMGEDGKLVRWADIVRYLDRLDARSERVLVRRLGKTTEGRDFIVVEVSSEENLRKRESLMRMARKI